MNLRSGKKIEANFVPRNLLEKFEEIEEPKEEAVAIQEEVVMAQNQTLRELAAPNLTAQPLSITYPALARPLKLNSGFLNLLPKFNGLPREDP